MRNLGHHVVWSVSVDILAGEISLSRLEVKSDHECEKIYGNAYFILGCKSFCKQFTASAKSSCTCVCVSRCESDRDKSVLLLVHSFFPHIIYSGRV